MDDENVAGRSLVREHDIGPGGSVVVAVEADDVRVRGVDGTTVRLVAPTRDHPALEVATEPGAYAVRLGQPLGGRVFGFRLGSRGVFGLEVGGGTVELDVPRDARLEIGTSSGDVNVRDVTGSLAVRTASGDISVRGAGGDLRVETASGSLRAVAAVPVAVTVRAVSGDVEIDAPRTERTNVTTVSGDVEIASSFGPDADHVVTTTSGDVELAVHGGATIEVRTVAGDVDCSHPDLRGGNGRRSPLVIGDGAARLAVRTLSGDVEVRAGRVRPDRPGGPAAGAEGISAAPASGVDRVSAARPTSGPVPAGTTGTLAILAALARGEIGVDEAERRLDGEGRADG